MTATNGPKAFVFILCTALAFLSAMLIWEYKARLSGRQRHRHPAQTSLFNSSNGTTLGTAGAKFAPPVVVWVHPVGYVNSTVTRLRSACPELACTVTFDTRRLANASVVIFDAHFPSFPKVPPPRPRGQVWVFYSQEAPPATAGSILSGAPWRSAFNWSATYRRDSDVWTPYGLVSLLSQSDRTGQHRNLTSVVAVKRRGVAAWMVSHCETPARREDYVSELQKHYRVDVWGSCGDHHCPRRQLEECEEKIAREYKFYLAFENSLCQDYATEKFFLRLRSDIIPVVRGGADYSKLAPRGSYVDTSEFAGPKELADYLRALDEDDTRYEAMLRHKRQFSVEYEVYTYRYGGSYYAHAHYLVRPLCQLCKMAAQPDKYKKQYENIYDWFNRDKCWKPKDLEG